MTPQELLESLKGKVIADFETYEASGEIYVQRIIFEDGSKVALSADSLGVYPLEVEE